MLGPQTPVECVPTPKGTHDSMSGLQRVARRYRAAHAVEPHAVKPLMLSSHTQARQNAGILNPRLPMDSGSTS